MSAMEQISIMILFSLSTGMDEISVVFEIIIVSAADNEKNGEFKEEGKHWEGRWKAAAFLIIWWLPEIPAKVWMDILPSASFFVQFIIPS